ncbi:MAG TPA: hypothetical protein VHB70_08210 [Parafilimonas sp.]|nr:hypothetical protein [Parafilimonas sp.]
MEEVIIKDMHPLVHDAKNKKSQLKFMERQRRTKKENKKFGEHFFDFLMVFLAVFLGFLAENVREYIVDRNREKDYAHSLINDLKEDDKTLKDDIRNNAELIADYGELLHEIKYPSSNHVNKLYYYFIPTNYYNVFLPVQRTIQQLESSGSFRLFKDVNISDSIASYYNNVRNTVDQGSTYIRYFDYYHSVSSQVFSYAQVDSFFYSSKQILSLPYPLALKTKDPQLIDLLYSKVFILKFILENNYENELTHLDKQALSMISLLKKKYS